MSIALKSVLVTAKEKSNEPMPTTKTPTVIAFSE